MNSNDIMISDRVDNRFPEEIPVGTFNDVSKDTLYR